MKKMRLINRLHSLSTLTVIIAMLAFGSAAAQNTSSSIRVNVSNEDGSAAGGVAVSITHVPTGRSQVLTSSSDGVVNARGLAIGGSDPGPGC